MTYLDVELSEGETWELHTPNLQTTGFIFPREGVMSVGNEVVPNQKMGILENNDGVIKVKALAPFVKFVLVLVEPSSFPLVMSRSSIHTNEVALERSMERIKNISELIHG